MYTAEVHKHFIPGGLPVGVEFELVVEEQTSGWRLFEQRLTTGMSTQGGQGGPGGSCVGREPVGGRAKERHWRDSGGAVGGQGGDARAPLMGLCFLGCRRVSASSKTRPRPGKGPQTCQEEVTDSRPFSQAGGNPRSGLVIYRSILSFCK